MDNLTVEDIRNLRWGERVLYLKKKWGSLVRQYLELTELDVTATSKCNLTYQELNFDYVLEETHIMDDIAQITNNEVRSIEEVMDYYDLIDYFETTCLYAYVKAIGNEDETENFLYVLYDRHMIMDEDITEEEIEEFETKVRIKTMKLDTEYVLQKLDGSPYLPFTTFNVYMKYDDEVKRFYMTDGTDREYISPSKAKQIIKLN